MARAVLTDAQWRLMEPHCLGKPDDPGRGGVDLIVVASATASKGLCMAGAKASPGPRNQRVITARELARSGTAAVTVSKENSGRAAGDAGTIGDYDLQLEFAISMPWRIWHEHRAFSRESRGLPPFLSPYSPDLDPMEMAFSNLKTLKPKGRRRGPAISHGRPSDMSATSSLEEERCNCFIATRYQAN